jgi:hypothetical protein
MREVAQLMNPTDAGVAAGFDDLDTAVSALDDEAQVSATA